MAGADAVRGVRLGAHRVRACDLSVEQVRVIVHAAEKVPATVTPEDKDTAVAALVERAVERGLEPARLRRAARRMLDKVSPAAADEHQKKLLEDEEKRAAGETYLSLYDKGDGTWAGKFVIPALHGAMLRAALERLTSPRRLSRNLAGELVEDESVGSRGYPEHLGDAFCELIEHLPTDGWPGAAKVAAAVMVHINQEHLDDGLAAAGLDTGDDISAGQARRMACGAAILPAVFGGPSVPLDLGRTQRLFNAAQRGALSSIYDTCAAEGCRRPFAWTELHHVKPWSQGGRTDLANALPLCGWHHRRIHDADYTHKLLPTGEVRFRRRPTGLNRQRLAAAVAAGRMTSFEPRSVTGGSPPTPIRC